MAAKVYDLSSYLEEKKSTIKLGDDVYEISDGFNDFLKLDALSSSRDQYTNPQFVKKFLEVSLGSEQAEKLISKNYKLSIYLKIIDSIQDAIAGKDDEESVSTVERADLV